MTPTASHCPLGEIATASGRCPTGKISTPWGGVRVMSVMLTLSVSPEFRPMLPTTTQRPFGAMATARGFDPTAMSPVRGPLRTSKTSRSALLGDLGAVDVQEGHTVFEAFRSELPLPIGADRRPGHAGFALGIPHLDGVDARHVLAVDHQHRDRGVGPGGHQSQGARGAARNAERPLPDSNRVDDPRRRDVEV